MATSYIKNFIESLFVPNEWRELASVLFITEQDCNDFYIGFLGRNTYIIDDLLDFRENKLAMTDISLDNFLEMCDNMSTQKAFETTFLQPFTYDEIELISTAISDGKTSLEDIYNRFQKNVNENILKYVL